MKNSSLKIFLAILLGIFTVSGCVSKNNNTSNIKEELQKLKKIGLPTTIDELVPCKLPDFKNGAFVYRKAFKIKDALEKRYNKEWKNIENVKEFNKVSAEDKKMIANIMVNDPSFLKFYRLVEKASKMKCQFLKKKDYQVGIDMPLDYLKQIRDCSKIVATKSKIEAELGEIDKALSTCLISFRIGKSLADEPVLLSQMVRTATDVIVLDTLNEIVNKGDGSYNLYEVLLKEIELEKKDDKIQVALKGELVIVMKSLEQWRNSKRSLGINSSFSNIGLEKEEIKKMAEAYVENPKKFWDDEEIFYLQTMSEAIVISQKPYGEAVREFQKLEEKVKVSSTTKPAFTRLILPGYSTLYVFMTRVNVYLDVAEIGVANRLYKSKYGKFADSPAHLTPEFLSSLPLDPFTGKDYIYKKNDKGFVVYSVGEDLKDDGGKHGEMKSGSDYDIVWEDKGK